MTRKKLIKAIFEGLGAMKRAMAFKHPHLPLGDKQPSYSQMALLFTLENHGPQSIKQIAKTFGMTSSAATQLVNGLVDNHYLKRSTDQSDRRKIAVEITTTGQILMDKAKEKHLEMMQFVFEGLTDQELELYLQLQQKIVKNLNSKYEQSKRTK